MKFKLTFLSVFLFILFLFQYSNAQDMYRYGKEEAENHFWKSKDPRIASTEVPEKYANNSAVALLEFTERELYSQSANANRIVNCYQYRIKLQDQAALEDYSELFFPSIILTMGHGIQKHFYGVKIVKSDGTEKIIDVGKEGVVEEKGRSKRIKLAMPGLEIGDIIDYYDFTYNYAPKTNYFGRYDVVDREPLRGEYPVMHYIMKAHIDENFRVEFVSGNGAPELKYEKEGKKGYLLTLEAADLKAQKSSLWYYPISTTPYFKLYAKYEKKFLGEWMKEHKKPYINEVIRDEMVSYYRPYYEEGRQSKNEYRAFNKYLEKEGKTNTSKEEKLEAYYYYLRNHFKNQFAIGDAYNKSGNRRGPRAVVFTGHMIRGIQELGMDYQVLVIMKRSDGDISKMLNTDESYYMIRVKSSGKEYFLYQPDEYTQFNRVPGTVEGTTAFALDSPDENARNLTWKNTTLPVAPHTENKVAYTSVIDLSNLGEPAKLSGSITTKGLANYSYQEEMVSPFDIAEVEDKHYGKEPWRGMEDSKDKEFLKKIKEMKAEYATQKDEYAKGLVENDFDDCEVEMGEVTLISTGHFLDNPEFKFSYDCTVDGLVKKLGPNYLLQAGKLVGGQVEIDEDEKKRDVDIDMPYARSYNYDVTISIPPGYTAEGLEKFDLTVENETGGFVSSAVQNGDKIVLKLYKYYTHNHESVDDWGKMVAFLDAAYGFTEQKILLRKN